MTQTTQISADYKLNFCVTLRFLCHLRTFLLKYIRC